MNTENKKPQVRHTHRGVTVKNSQAMVGEFNPKRKSRGKKGRSLRTYENKLQKLQSIYNKRSKNEKFKNKYPTFSDFLAKNTLKQTTKS